ncbi:MAG: nucleotide exchange factor GrpE [Verrucomicrobiae bacterium]|nr:nucleotide exchange factor GrpE [Verrucomicrobiae bacterium]
MSDAALPRPSVLPFLIGDLLLLAVAGGIVYQSDWPLSTANMALCTAAVAAGAWLLVTPFILQHRAALKLAEADTLRSTVAQIQNLEQIKQQIAEATANWMNIQGECARTVQTAREVADGMAAEARAFTDFLRQANDTEKATLRLEADKLRRQEQDWLQLTLRLLDQIFALYTAACQSGQPHLVEQIGLFQNVCRDLARRVGVNAFAPEPGAAFDPQMHQAHQAAGPVPAGAPIQKTLAPGYTYQGRVLRPALVQLATPAPAGPAAAAEAPAASGPEAPTAQPDLPI